MFCIINGIFHGIDRVMQCNKQLNHDERSVAVMVLRVSNGADLFDDRFMNPRVKTGERPLGCYPEASFHHRRKERHLPRTDHRPG